MKKLKLSWMNLSEVEILTREQLKVIVAGAGFSCTCSKGISNNGLVAWAADYSSTEDILKAIDSKCGNQGGTCTAITTVPDSKPVD